MIGKKGLLRGLLDREERISAQPGFLRPIDTKGLSNKLKIDAEAHINGQNELPESSAREADSKEKEIINYLLSEYHWQVDAFYSELRAYSNRLTQFSIQAEFQQLKILANDTLAKLNAASSQAEAALGPKFESFKEHHQELCDFRKHHGLSRPARDTAGWFYSVGLILFLLAIESIINGVFFAKGASLGLLGGVFTAIGISFVNVVSAFLMGLGPARWLSHRDLFPKLAGFFLLVAYICGNLFLQAFAAHFRDASAIAEGKTAFSSAVASLFRNPFQLDDINSYYLIGLGLLFSLFGFLKGYYQDDPYPGYGAEWRRFSKARSDYSAEHEDLFEELEEAKDECIAELNEGVAKLPKYPQTAAKIDVQRNTTVGKFQAYEAGLIEATNEMLIRYRQRNKASRTTPAPSYFSEKWNLPERASESAQIKALMTAAPVEKVNIDGLLNELNGLAEAILGKYSMLVERYPHPTRMTNG